MPCTLSPPKKNSNNLRAILGIRTNWAPCLTDWERGMTACYWKTGHLYNKSVHPPILGSVTQHFQKQWFKKENRKGRNENSDSSQTFSNLNVHVGTTTVSVLCRSVWFLSANNWFGHLLNMDTIKCLTTLVFLDFYT